MDTKAIPGDPVTMDHRNQVGQFVYQTYLVPAKGRGDLHVTVDVRRVWKALDCVYPVFFIRDVLESAKFRDAYGVILEHSFAENFPFQASFTFRLDRATNSQH